MRHLISILSIAILLGGCAHHLVGKKLNPNYCRPLDKKEQTHNISYRNSAILVHHVIDETNNTIAFDGELIFYPDEVSGPPNVNAQIQFLFCDENFMAIASNQAHISNQPKDKPMAFKNTFKYDKRYKYFYLGWNALLH